MDAWIQKPVLATDIIISLECAHIRETLKLSNFKLKIISIKCRVGSKLRNLKFRRIELYFYKQEAQITWILILHLMNAVMTVCAIRMFAWIIWSRVIRNINGLYALGRLISQIRFCKNGIGESRN